jgi:hypothetical protein
MEKTLDELRNEAADLEFETYNFAPETVADTSGWGSTDPGDEMRRAVFFVNPDDPEADSDLGSFCVRFASDDSAEVVDAYGTIDGNDVGHRDPDHALTTAGFTKVEGAAAPAWRKALEDGSSLVLTQNERGPSQWVASRVDEQRGSVCMSTALYVGTAIQVAKSLPAPAEIGETGCRHEFATEAEIEAALSLKSAPSI